MVDLQGSTTVCCMCGDIGFPDKLFRCHKCLNRLQHSYCSNYYSEYLEPVEVCDWCQSEERSSKRGSSSSSSSSSKKSGASRHESGGTNRSEYSGIKIKQQHEDRAERGTTKNHSGVPSPRPTTRRYKLLKDVIC